MWPLISIPAPVLIILPVLGLMIILSGLLPNGPVLCAPIAILDDWLEILVGANGGDASIHWLLLPSA